MPLRETRVWLGLELWKELNPWKELCPDVIGSLCLYIELDFRAWRLP